MVSDRLKQFFASLSALWLGKSTPPVHYPVPPPPEPIPYRAFTTDHDKVATAGEVIRWLGAPISEAAGLGSNLLDQFSVVRASGLARGLAFQQRWVNGHTLGKRPLITLLIDHSGSMRGARAATAALVVDAIGSALEFEEVPFDVLGYTTTSWSGGLARRDWLLAGSPPYPGRVCDLLHIIYRDALNDDGKRTRWRDGLRLLLADAALKENIDGEALLWAWERAKTFAPTAWICLVISDGAPVDDTTLTVSGPDILHDHIQQVSRDASTAGARLGGIGLEFDVSLYYPTAKSVKVLAEAPNIAFDVLEALIWQDASATEADTNDAPVLH